MGNSGIWSCWQTERYIESEDKSGNVEKCWGGFHTSGRRKDGEERRQEKKMADGREEMGEHFHLKVEMKHTLYHIKSFQCRCPPWPFLCSKWVDHKAIIHAAKWNAKLWSMSSKYILLMYSPTYQRCHCTLLSWAYRGFLHLQWRICHNWRRLTPVHPSCRFSAHNVLEQRSSGCCRDLWRINTRYIIFNNQRKIYVLITLVLQLENQI